MPDYKKKRKHYKRINKDKYSDTAADISMSRSEPKKEKRKKTYDITPPKLIKGKKQIRAARAKVIAISLAVIAVIVLILKWIFPVGILEMSRHFINTLGVGDYPIELAGNEIVDVSTENDHYYILTNTDLYPITNGGKVLKSFAHGFNSPVIKSSASRALIYGQGKNEYDVYVNGEKKYSGTTESGIICGDISDSGIYAVASHSKTYTSTVTVYKSSGASLFKWNSASDIINAIVLSKNGKRLAVSTVNATGGKKYSKIYVFNFNNTNAESTFVFDDNFAYNLVANNNGFYVLLKKSVTFINWSNKTQAETKSDFMIKHFKSGPKSSIAVFSREDNDSDNSVIIFDKKGNKTSNISYSGSIKDIALKNNRIFILSGNKVSVYDTKGQFVNQIECNELGRKIVPVDASKFCIITDNLVTSYQIK